MSTSPTPSPTPSSDVGDSPGRLQRALAVIDEACEIAGPDAPVFAMTSGGHDSMATLSVAKEHPRFTAAVHLNTGVGVEQTREYVREQCGNLGLRLIEYHAAENVNAKGEPDPQVYEQIVLEHGFPGPTKFGHGYMYTRLKERSLRRLLREHAQGTAAILVTGVRSQESSRRMGFVEPIQVGEKTKSGVTNKRRIWCAPIHDWTKLDCTDRMKEAGIPRNIIADLLHKSGECYCGGFGTEGELEELLMWPQTRAFGEYMMDLQRRVMEKHPWAWHERKPKWCMEAERGQQMAFDLGPLCQNCGVQQEGES